MSHPLDPLRRALESKRAAMNPQQLAEFRQAVARRRASGSKKVA